MLHIQSSVQFYNWNPASNTRYLLSDITISPEINKKMYVSPKDFQMYQGRDAISEQQIHKEE